MNQLQSWRYVNRKAVKEVVEHTIDFDERIDDNDSLSAAHWSFEPDDNELSLVDQTVSQNTATTRLESGDDGVFYAVSCLAETNQGLKYERGLVVPVGNIYQEPDSLTRRRAMFMSRQFLRDYPDENELLFGELEYDWSDMKLAAQMAMNDWNQTPPVSNTDLEDFPKEVRNLLYRRIAIELIHMGTHGQARNQYNYSDQGFSVQENDKAPMYMRLAQQMEQKYEKRKKKWKMTQNMRTFWGGQHSDSFYKEPGSGYY
jgi:hypothetical protein